MTTASSEATQATRHVVVVGAGIAGLAAAYRLSRDPAGVRVTLLERDGRLGGKIVTDYLDGFVIDGGPDSFLAGKPRGVGLAREIGLGERLQATIAANRRTFVAHQGRLHDLPEGLTGLVPTRLRPLARSSLLTVRGKGRLALDFVLPAKRGDDDETLANFIQRRLGKEVYERLVEPLMAGIYAGDGRYLSLTATFPHLRRAEREHGGLIRGVLAGRTTPVSSPPVSPFVSLPMGLGELVAQLETVLRERGVTIRTGCPVRCIEREQGAGYRLRFDGDERLIADAVVLATPAGATANLVGGLAPAAVAPLRGIEHVSTATVALAFRVDELGRDLRGYGYVIPRVEGRRALACTWVSSKWPGRAPDGFALLRVFVGRSGQADVMERDDAELVAIARDEVRETMGGDATPVLCRVYRWPNGMPQYTLGHLERVAAIEQVIAALPGLAIAGHAYRGVGIPDCIASGEAAAERVLAMVRR